MTTGSGTPASCLPAARPREGSGPCRELTLFLAGDVMTGRGIDQALPHPCSPELFEPYVTSALSYVALAEDAHGPIPRPLGFADPWGDALAELEARRPAARIINLETAVTTHAEPEPKGINYRMNPANMPVLAAAGVDCCVLANNHVLDWQRPGLLETLETLEQAGIAVAGAGRGRNAAAAPAILPTGNGGRLLVFAFAAPSSGIPPDWAATAERPGVNFLPDLSPRTVERIAAEIGRAKRPGDVVVASIHWGPNWGYKVPAGQVAFAHGLIDRAGVAMVHGHSSHHPKGIEVHRGRLILYGCGDFLNDYEGIAGYEAYRGDLVAMYLPTVRAGDGALVRLTIVPFLIRKFRLNRAPAADTAWLRDVLDRESRKLGAAVRLEADGTLSLACG